MPAAEDVRPALEATVEDILQVQERACPGSTTRELPGFGIEPIVTVVEPPEEAPRPSILQQAQGGGNSLFCCSFSGFGL